VRRRLLIIDDHAEFRSLARAVLEAEGFDVVGEAEDGESGVAQSARLRPDVVLLDVQLPDLDGFDVVDRLTAGGDVPEVILTSSRDPSAYRRRLASSSARGFVPKSDLSGEALDTLLS
jgi:DNA-binding NarL/FixJ family response regulator